MNPKDKHADWLLKPTANELADELDWVCENHLIGIGNADFKATATMLRQQQAKLTKYELRHAEQRKRIEELEKEVKHWQDAFHKGVRL